MKLKSFFFVVLIAALSSCQKVLLKQPAGNTPTNNFTALWKGYSDYYGLFAVRNVQWDSLYDVYSPQVHDKMSNQELYAVLTKLITPLNDIHVFLQPTTDRLPRYESSVFFRTHSIQQDFSIQVVKQNYVPSLIEVNEKLHYGVLAGNMGYIHFGAFDLPLGYYSQQMDKITEALKDTRGLIVDIRNHEGGDDKVSRYIAGRFANAEKPFMTIRKRNGTDRNSFTAPESWKVGREGSSQYTKPVALLTTRWTASAGETFTWAMNTQQHVTQIGDTTAGGFSDVISRELPNGWLYFVPVGDYRNASGRSEEGIGIAPKIWIANTQQDIHAGKDRVLEAAVSRLK